MLYSILSYRVETFILYTSLVTNNRDTYEKIPSGLLVNRLEHVTTPLLANILVRLILELIFPIRILT